MSHKNSITGNSPPSEPSVAQSSNYLHQHPPESEDVGYAESMCSSERSEQHSADRHRHPAHPHQPTTSVLLDAIHRHRGHFVPMDRTSSSSGVAAGGPRVAILPVFEAMMTEDRPSPSSRSSGSSGSSGRGNCQGHQDDPAQYSCSSSSGSSGSGTGSHPVPPHDVHNLIQRKDRNEAAAASQGVVEKTQRSSRRASGTHHATARTIKKTSSLLEGERDDPAVVVADVGMGGEEEQEESSVRRTHRSPSHHSGGPVASLSSSSTSMDEIDHILAPVIQRSSAPLSTGPHHHHHHLSHRSLTRRVRQRRATGLFFHRCPCAARWSLFAQLATAFGINTLGAFTMIYFIVKGISTHMISSATLPMLKDVFHVEAGLYQQYANIGTMGWAMKPLIGLWSDQRPLYGYHKRSYMLLATMIGVIVITTWILLPGEAWIAPVAAGCAFIANTCLATLDLLTEGKYSELMVRRPETGSALVSWVRGCAMFGGTIAAALEGPFADNGHPRYALCFAAICLTPLLLPLARNWIGERRSRVVCNTTTAREDPSLEMERVSITTSAASSIGVDNEVGQQQHPSMTSSRRGSNGLTVERPRHLQSFQSIMKNILFGIWSRHEGERIASYCGMVSLSALALVLLTICVSRATLAFSTTLIIFFLSWNSFRALPLIIAKANLFMFLKELLYLNISGPLDYFFTADAQCVPNGPHFSYTYYQTFTSIVGYAAGGIGVAIFHSFFSNRSFRYTFFVTTAIKIAASIVDIILVKRWNISWFGISDKATYFMGDAIVFGACSMLDFMPAVVLISKLCPKGMEATLYALLAGFSNFGQVVSSTLGYLLYQFVFPIRSTPEAAPASSTSSPVSLLPCDFSNLPILILVSHCLLPLLVIPLVYVLVPQNKMNENVCEGRANEEDQ